MKRNRITVEIRPGDRERIETVVKKEYPKLKNVSDVVRTALQEYLKNT
jgi:Arc/MetJ-type ribon-helix-helix transcriptional regulator